LLPTFSRTKFSIRENIIYFSFFQISYVLEGLSFIDDDFYVASMQTHFTRTLFLLQQLLAVNLNPLSELYHIHN